MNHSCKIWEASFSVLKEIHPIFWFIFFSKSVVIRALSYNEHVSQLRTIWHGLGKYKAKHRQEIICLSRQNCANLGIQRALLTTTALPLTGTFLCALIEKVVISLPIRGVNISISLQGWTNYEVSSALYLYWHRQEGAQVSATSHMNLFFK